MELPMVLRKAVLPARLAQHAQLVVSGHLAATVSAAAWMKASVVELLKHHRFKFIMAKLAIDTVDGFLPSTSYGALMLELSGLCHPPQLGLEGELLCRSRR